MAEMIDQCQLIGTLSLSKRFKWVVELCSLAKHLQITSENIKWVNSFKEKLVFSSFYNHVLAHLGFTICLIR